MQEKADLTPKQQRVITELLSGKSIVATAKEVGVNQATIHNWFKTPTFQERYREAKARVFDERLDELEEDVFAALVKHIRADTRPSGWTQLAALRLWFDMKGESGRMRELEQEFEEWRQSQKQRGDDEQLEDLG